MSGLARNRILLGDATTRLRELPTASIDMVLTSPPYFRLRDYGVPGQLGQEDSVNQWVEQLVAVAEACARPLVPTGSFWINVGDTYSVRPRQGAHSRSLLLAPERLALRLTGSGWILRNKIVWQKTNPLPTSVRNRLNATYELIYVFVRAGHYFFDLDAVRQPHRSRPPGARDGATMRPGSTAPPRWTSTNSASRGGLTALRARGLVGHPLGKNPGDVWAFGSARGTGPHHAAFPVNLAEWAIQAGTPEQRCRRCRQPYRRATIRAIGGTAVRSALQAGCDCRTGSEPGIVLDPFMGTGTTAVAAERLARDWLGIELNPAFVALADARIQDARAARAAA